MKKTNEVLVYWDSSAILSVLFQDTHSKTALPWLHKKGVHLVSSLAISEVYAVIARLERENVITNILAKSACAVLETGLWKKLLLLPSLENIKSIAFSWPLRGADLWHLALAKTLQEERPEIIFLSFDQRLKTAAKNEVNLG